MLRRSKSSTEPSKRKSGRVIKSASALCGALLLFVPFVLYSQDGWWTDAGPTHFPNKEESSPKGSFSKPDEPHFEQGSCPEALRVAVHSYGRKARCGQVDVSASLRQLHRVKIHAVEISCPGSARASGRDCNELPLVVFAGGPGDAMTPGLHLRLDDWLPHLRSRKLLFIDARGTGQSRPLLTCPSAIRGDEDLERCFQRWDQEVDLDAFGTSTHVEDARKVLDALKIDAVVAYGVSYGTHLATELARLHPERVQALVLDSPLPRGMDVLSPIGKVAQQALAALFLECHKQGVCHGELSLQVLSEMVVKMDEARLSGHASSVPGGTRFASALVHLLHAPSVLPYIPFLVSRAQKGDFRLFWKLQEMPPGARAFPWGMHLSTQCAERFPLTTEANMSASDAEVSPGLTEALSGKHYLRYCRVWKVAPRPATKLKQKLSVPALILSGRYDSSTPLSYAQTVRDDFENARVVTIHDVGHGAALSDCGGRVMRRFLEDLRFEGLNEICRDSPAFLMSAPSEQDVKGMRREIYHRL